MPATFYIDPPKKCDLCKRVLKSQFVDGATKYGTWAIMCMTCHGEFGRGIGLGRGQEYTKQPSDRWLKTGG